MAIKRSMSKFLVIACFLIGNGISVFLFERFSSEAHDVWGQRGEQFSAWLSQTFITWLDESQLAIIALTTLAENSETLTDEELAGAFDSLEQRSKAFFLENAIILSKVDGQVPWAIDQMVNRVDEFFLERLQIEIQKIIPFILKTTTN